MNEDLMMISKAAPPFDPETADDELRNLAISLYADNYLALAAALARYVEHKQTLDQAFGLRRTRRGSPSQRETLDRDTRVLKARLDNMSYFEIADKEGMDERTVGAICRPDQGFEKRHDAALAELLSMRLDESGG